MEFKEFPKMARLSREIIITEKIDGTNASIFIQNLALEEDINDPDIISISNGDIKYTMRAGSRTKWITPQNDNFGFANWCKTNANELFKLGEGHHFGEWWGCLAYGTSIKLANGSLCPIGKIVNNKLSLDVLSFNFITGKIEPKRIIGWKKESPTENWLTIRVKRKWRGGHQIGLHLTPNHIVYRQSENGLAEECRADSLKVGDKLYMNSESPSYIQEQVIRGSLMGDGSINNNIFSCGHSNEQYSKSKIKILDNLVTNVNNTTYSGKGSLMYKFSTKSLPLLRDIQEETYVNGVKKIKVNYIKKLHPCGLAFWYMDDGSLQTTENKSPVCSIYTNGFEISDVKQISEYFNKVGYKNYVCFNDNKPIIKFTPEGTIAFHATIAPYIMPEMKYKIIPRFHSLILAWNDLTFIKDTNVTLALSEIVSIDNTYAKQSRSKIRYDIEVEDNHNFFANNLLVHNSGIQRKYNLPKGEKRFSLFNVSRWQDPDIRPSCCHVVPVLYQGLFDTTMCDAVLFNLKENGSRAAPGFMDPEGIVVYHTAGNVGFKKTILNDDTPKSLVK